MTRKNISEESRSLLDEMRPVELADVLCALIEKHPELATEAEEIAAEMVSSPSVEDVAGEVFFAVTAPGIEELNHRAGPQPWGGYVGPDEAAWELLEEAMEDTLSDMKRCVKIGQRSAAEAICAGIVLGLYEAAHEESEPGVLGWAPDFPADMACDTLRQLLDSLPAHERPSARSRLLEALGDEAGEWRRMIEKASGRLLAGQ